MLPRGTAVIQYLEHFGVESQFMKHFVSGTAFTADPAEDILTVLVEFETGDIVKVTSAGTLPDGLEADTEYYAIAVSETTVRLAESLKKAYLNEYIDIIDEGTGAQAVVLYSYRMIDYWIQNEVNNFIEKMTRCSFQEIREVTEYYSGNGKTTLFLNRRNVVALVSIVRMTSPDYATSADASNVEVLGDQGMLKAVSEVESSTTGSRIFEKGEKNLKITYTYGYDNIPNDVKQAYIFLAAEMALGHIANRTGGGDISTQAWSRSWGPRGKYTHMRQDLRRQAIYILKQYATGVSGS